MGGTCGKSSSEVVVKRSSRMTMVNPKYGKTENLPEDENAPDKKGKVDNDGFVFTWGVHNKKGFVPGVAKVNQDNYIAKADIMLDWGVFGVFDGHGENGQMCSKYLRDYIPKLLMGHEASLGESATNDQINKALDETMVTVDHRMCKKSGINVEASGTTACWCLVRRGHLAISNTGDSRAVLVTEDNDGNIKCEGLTEDHKAESRSEGERIVKCGGRVEPVTLQGVSVGPSRVWLKNEDIPGLAVTRACGDVIAKEAGVIPNPDVTHLNIQPEHKAVIFGSDGLWDFLELDETAQLLKVFKDKHVAPKDVAYELVLEAFHRWKEEEVSVDDITCVALFFNEWVDTSGLDMSGVELILSFSVSLF